jgi:hypothetical protein
LREGFYLHHHEPFGPAAVFAEITDATPKNTKKNEAMNSARVPRISVSDTDTGFPTLACQETRRLAILLSNKFVTHGRSGIPDSLACHVDRRPTQNVTKV